MSAVSQVATEEAPAARSFESTITQAASFTAFVAGTVGLLYVIGGAVLWLRFHEAGIPADRAVALVPKNDLLVLGLRVMVIPAVASGLFLLALGSAWRARESRLEELLQEREEKRRRLDKLRGDDGDENDDDAKSIERRVQVLEGKIKRSAESGAAGDHLPRPGSNPIAFAILMFAALAVALVVPFSVGAFAWPVVLACLLGYWWHLRPVRPDPKGSRFPIWRLALAAVIGAATISIARQTDRPVELLSVRAEVVDAPALVTGTLKPTDVHTERHHKIGDIGGVLVAIRSGELAIGDPDHRLIASVPRSYVRAMTIGPPLDQRAPPRSLLSRFIGHSSWAVTPLELWCANVRYGWNRIGHACHGAPKLIVPHTLAIVDDRIRGIRVRCPAAADGQCHGFVKVITKKLGADAGLPSTALVPVSIAPAEFQIQHGASDEVQNTAQSALLFQWLAARVGRPGHHRPIRVEVRVELTLEQAGNALVEHRKATLVVPPPPTRRSRHDKHGAKQGKKHRDRPRSQSGGGGSVPSSPHGRPGRPSSSATPTATAAPEVPSGAETETPTGPNPLPQQNATLEVPTPEPTAAPTP